MPGSLRKLATQARDPAPHYQHSEIGYNYRLSNVLAGIGREQLQVLEERVWARRRNFDFYQQTIGDLPGMDFMPEAPWGPHTRWQTIDIEDFTCPPGTARRSRAMPRVCARSTPRRASPSL